MSNSVAAWTHVLQQLMPNGKAWPRDTTSDLYKLISALAKRYQKAELNAQQLLTEMRPETTVQMMSDWETYLGLPECSSEDITFEARRAALVEKYHRKGGLSVWKIQKLCEDLGFEVEVLEAYPHHCLRTCVTPIYPERYRYLVQINVNKIPNGRFTVTDNVLTRLMSDRAVAFECLLNSYCLAGTSYEIEYLD
jgi:uncharacterized protein YmfQ (DUF2313 family)